MGSVALPRRLQGSFDMVRTAEAAMDESCFAADFLRPDTKHE
jgi:hypothetical protein